MEQTGPSPENISIMVLQTGPSLENTSIMLLQTGPSLENHSIMLLQTGPSHNNVERGNARTDSSMSRHCWNRQVKVWTMWEQVGPNLYDTGTGRSESRQCWNRKFQVWANA